ncbi:hypothetical protein MKX07_002774 [Trichoderma sp. CBMAI-0711]|nr:hypothetical protein MKX07_002774 [Trichoderma sp. CBMAI-0711]
MQIRSPLRLTSTIDIVDRATSISHIENHTRGALVSIDLNCPADLFYGRKKLVAKFSLSFTTKILDGFHKPVAIQDAKVGCFESDNNIENMINDPKIPLPSISDEAETTFKNGIVDIEMKQPEDSRNIRIVVLLEAYPSNMQLLKYFESVDGDNDGPKDAPRSDDLVALDGSEIEKELDDAVRDMRAGRSKQKWLASQMERAAREGTLCFVQVLKTRGAEVNPRHAGDRNEVDGATPLMSAIENDRIQVAEFLISHGAGDEEALRTAVERKQHNTIRKLLQVGIPVNDSLKKDLLATATRKKDSTTLMLLKLERGTGKLATPRELHHEVDGLFEATVVDFFADKDPVFQEVSVAQLMDKDENFFSVNDEPDVKFRWFHLPENNMKWAEHEGERGSAHARFMISACHDFSEAFKGKKSQTLGNGRKDKHVFLFMPYLHWDEEEAMQGRSQFIAENSPGALKTKSTKLKSAKEEQLLRSYLLQEDHCDPNARHVLHIRRTLDQYLYHNLKDTKVRDADQTVHRYQKRLNREKQDGQEIPLTAIMVDQLWLWILPNPSGEAQAIVTCFPSRDWNDVGMKATEQNRILDSRRTTDVLQITKAYIQQRPSAVQTPYDLAGVVASRCSRALLDHSSDMLNFAEVYENSISYIMNEEAMLFNTFNTLMQTRTDLDKSDDEDDDLKVKPSLNRAPSFKGLSHKIMDDLKSLEKLLESEMLQRYKVSTPVGIAGQVSDEKQEPGQKQTRFHDAEQLCKGYRKYTEDREIPNDTDIKSLRKLAGEEKIKHLINLLEKFGRFYVLDITREITLLRQIKDIQDELEIMDKVFAEQKEALDCMDRIIRSMNQPPILPNNDAQVKASTNRPAYRRASHGRTIEREFSGHHRIIHMDDDTDSEGEDILAKEYSMSSSSGGSFELRIQTTNDSPTKRAQSMVWGDLRERQNLPLRTISRHIKQIRRMNERAKNTNVALSTLVDLKQKQNNMIDARTARLQAEQSHLMTLEAEKQGRTLMVFTIVTIVFLPLSFIAAFFAIPTKEFDNNSLTLGYVSKITFPLSAAISLVFIAIGFLASKWTTEKVKNKWNSVV